MGPKPDGALTGAAPGWATRERGAPVLPRNGKARSESDVWKALMEAAVRVHRYHAAKATAATSGQSSEHVTEEDESQSAPAQQPRHGPSDQR
jgi:hypothetical protein